MQEPKLPPAKHGVYSVRRWITHNQKSISIGIGVCVLLTIGVAVAAVVSQQPTSSVPVPLTHKINKKPDTPKFYSPLTGLSVADESATKSNVTAIMIENSPDARPQSGLKDADVVYEAIAEGGITRFAALYQQSRPELIGPVRSLRMYYIDWIAPYDASVAHVGGSLHSLQEIRNGNHKDVDQFFNAGTYWRSDDRYAPHNVYTSFANLDALNLGRGYTTANPQPIPRSDATPNGTPATQVTVTMSGPLYNSSWRYDPSSKQYLRSQANQPHLDREKGQICTAVLVVLDMQMDKVMEDGWRENYHTSGTGDAMIFSEGKATAARWHKENMSQQLSFTNKTDGKELSLPRGKTWLSAVPINQGGGSSWQ